MESFHSARRYASFKQTYRSLHVQLVLVKLRTQRSECLFFTSSLFRGLLFSSSFTTPHN